MSELIYLTYIAVLLVFGVMASVVSNRLKISKYVFLLFFGIILGNIKYGGVPVIDFSSTTFLLSISTLALVMVVFDGSSRFKLKELDHFYGEALRLAIIFLGLSIFIISPLTYNLFGLNNILAAVFFAIIISGTDPTSMFGLFKDKTNKVAKMMEVESVLNTPIIVVLSFIVLDMIDIGFNIESILQQSTPLFLQVTVGIGTGMVVGIIFFKQMRRYYNEQISPLALIAAGLVTYLLAENMDGNGVLAVATLGLFFGNVYIKKKDQLQEFSSTFGRTLEILVFMMIGIMIDISFEPIFLLKSLILFIFILLVRYVAIRIAFFHDGFNNKEKFFMALNIPKGITIAVIVFSAAIISMDVLKTVLDLTILIMIYSLILSSIMARYSQSFIRIKVE
ncbi:hypothetical protein C0585_02815 [Candidatus Woesearchaeota archaeon]|nr:MAG: hypothetical protein C0585_02815 [Candidatus Woesearchaeota archaeon]